MQVPALPNLQDIVTGIVTGIDKILTDWSNQVATNTAQGADTLIRQAVDWFRTDTSNFVLHTPLNLVDALSGYIGLQSVEPLLQAVAQTAFLFAVAAWAGHYWFGWPHIADSVQRIAVTVIIVGMSDRLLDMSLQITDSIASAIVVSMPGIPSLQGQNPITIVVMLAFWAFLLARLALAMGKRIAWLAVLKAAMPLALILFIHDKTAWIATTVVKLWVGWLIAQVLVVLALALTAAFINIGGFAGYILSCAALYVAHDAVYIFAPKDAGLSISVGKARIGI